MKLNRDMIKGTKDILDYSQPDNADKSNAEQYKN